MALKSLILKHGRVIVRILWLILGVSLACVINIQGPLGFFLGFKKKKRKGREII